MLLLSLACAPHIPTAATLDPPPLGEGVAALDFELVDDNPTSATYGQVVSPSQFLDRVSVWYFGHST